MRPWLLPAIALARHPCLSPPAMSYHPPQRRHASLVCVLRLVSQWLHSRFHLSLLLVSLPNRYWGRRFHCNQLSRLFFTSGPHLGGCCHCLLLRSWCALHRSLSLALAATRCGRVASSLLLRVPPVNPSLWTTNIKTFVTTTLES